MRSDCTHSFKRAAPSDSNRRTAHIRATRSEDDLCAMRDYFWMVGRGILVHSRSCWTSFRAGYAATALADLHFDAPRSLRRRVA